MNIEKVKIVADSSADLLTIDDIPFEVAPLKIRTEEKEYVDDASLDVEKMVGELDEYTGESRTSCPSSEDWINAFADAEYVFCVTITSALSGSCNSAQIAKHDYEEEHPQRKVFVLDSRSAGPEIALLVEKIRELILEGLSFESVCEKITEYQKRTKLLFILESMKNLANNGRVSHFTAKLAGILGIRLVGKASDEGTLEPIAKKRGEISAMTSIVENLRKLLYMGGKINIAHCNNESAAEKLKEMILKEFTLAKIQIYKCRGICSFYAEKGGVLVGFETN